jgi:hypothetical protein
MQNLPNIDKSVVRPREYVGYGGGGVYRIRKDGVGNWEALARAPWQDCQYFRAPTLAKISATLAGMAQPASDRTR